MPACQISFERLRSVLDYDPETGHFWWRPRKGDTPHARTWNTRFSGKIAGSTSNGLGYVLIRVDGVTFYAHRLAVLWMTGREPANQVDHINMKRDDNRWSNLRAATKAENMHNTGRIATNQSGYKGVHWHSQRNKWTARIKSNGRGLYLGLFETREEAAAAYEAAARELHGEFVRLAK